MVVDMGGGSGRSDMGGGIGRSDMGGGNRVGCSG